MTVNHKMQSYSNFWYDETLYFETLLLNTLHCKNLNTNYD